MKVIHLINLEKMGGAEKIFLQYIRESNHENIIFCISNSVDESILDELGDHQVLYVNRFFNHLSIKIPSFARSAILKLKIKLEAADVLMVWDLVPKFRKKPKDIKVMYYDHGSSWVFPDNARTKAFFSYVDAAIAPSLASKKMMSKRLAANFPINIVPNTLPFDNYEAFPKKSPVKDYLVLGTASRLAGVKGITISILTVFELLKRGVNTRLLIAGKGPDEIALKRLVKNIKLEDHVSFVGYCENLDDFYQSIHLYMSTSFAESFGLSCLDAQRHGVPCIYSIIDGQPEVNIDGVTGIGIKPTLSLHEYFAQIGYVTDVERQHVYDPLSDIITSPKAVSYIHCADAIEELLQENYYYELLKNIENNNKLYFDKMSMVINIDNYISRIKDK